MYLKRIVMVALAAVLSCTGLAPALADEAIDADEVARSVYLADDPDQAYLDLSSAEQEALQERGMKMESQEVASVTIARPATMEELSARALAAGGCYSTYKHHKWYDLAIHTGDTWMTAHWCHDGSKITSYRLSGQGGAGYKGIKYVGLGQKYTRNVGWEVRQAQQFEFSLLWATAQPCMQLRGGTNNKYSFRPTCNLS